MSAPHQLPDNANANFRFAFFLNFFFVIVELIGGVWTNSLAILADAFHDLGDCLLLGLAWGLQVISKRASNAKFSYGYQRFSVLGSVISALVLIATSWFVAHQAVLRLLAPQPVQATGMFFFALLGIAVNGAAWYKMHGGHKHSAASSALSLSEKTLALHLLEDTLGWAAVLLVSLGALLFPSLPLKYVDPALSLAISLLVGWHALKSLKAGTTVLLQSNPEEVVVAELKKKLTALPAVARVHDLHLWSLEGTKHVLSVHLVLKDQNTSVCQLVDLKKEIRKRLKQNQVYHATIEFETAQESCEFENCC